MQIVSLLTVPLLWAAHGHAPCYDGSLLSTDCPPVNCSDQTGCVRCVTTVGCSWCSLPNNNTDNGWDRCTAADEVQPTRFCVASRNNEDSMAGISNNNRFWRGDSCPLENECITGNHNCDPTFERCVDTGSGFECWCTDGYERKNGSCVSNCPDGCVNGFCVHSNNCQCHFGFVGPTCEHACNCNGHSTCTTQDLDTCIECHNNTKGLHCELCETGYVRKGNSCVVCREFCYNHSDICLSAKMYSLIHAFDTAPPKMLIDGKNRDIFLDDRTVNSVTIPAICVNCSDYTKGLQCEYCQTGYFRPPNSTPWTPCVPCDCNSHGVDSACNPQRGDGCECRNNTVTPHDCKDDCWRVQCSACKDHFRGVPINDHQCYREITEPNEDICFASDLCSSSRFKSSHPLRPLELSFFVIIPEYSNVDVRITVDVGHGKVDVFLAVADVFTARYVATAGCHVLSWPTPGYNAGISQSGLHSGGFSYQLDDCAPGHQSNWASVDVRGTDTYLSSYFIYQKPSFVLMIRNVASRAVIVAPVWAFDLKSTRFYLVLRARKSGAGAWGYLSYSQDPAHFDLFIFFTVFFAAFFLFTAVVLVAWRIKMFYSDQRHVQAQTVELMKLAKRPFARFALLYEQLRDCSSRQDSCGPWPICFQTLRKKSVAVATVVIKMPGGAQAPVKLAFASALISTLSVARWQEAQAYSPKTDVGKGSQARRYVVSNVRYRVQPA